MTPDRPPLPNTIPLHTKVIVRLPHLPKPLNAFVIGAAAQKEQPILHVRSGAQTMWVAREFVTLAPPPLHVRASRWIKSFIFGEK